MDSWYSSRFYHPQNTQTLANLSYPTTFPTRQIEDNNNINTNKDEVNLFLNSTISSLDDDFSISSKRPRIGYENSINEPYHIPSSPSNNIRRDTTLNNDIDFYKQYDDYDLSSSVSTKNTAQETFPFRQQYKVQQNFPSYGSPLNVSSVATNATPPVRPKSLEPGFFFYGTDPTYQQPLTDTILPWNKKENVTNQMSGFGLSPSLSGFDADPISKMYSTQNLTSDFIKSEKEEFPLEVPSMIPSSSNPSTSASNDSAKYFALLEQPHYEQRKSYEKENRYLLPNPVVVLPKPSWRAWLSQNVVKGIVTVSLMDEDGNEVKENVYQKYTPRKKSMGDVSSSVLTNASGFLHDFLDPSELSAEFALKVLINSGVANFQLKFVVALLMRDGTAFEDTILSSPFMVQANKKVKTKPIIDNDETVVVTRLHPSKGCVSPHSQINVNNEVWIRGNNFRKGIEVHFGKVASPSVQVIASNLLVVEVPRQKELSKSTSVQVTLSFGKEKKNIKIVNPDAMKYTYEVQESVNNQINL